MITMLWVDDQIAELETLVSYLREHGFVLDLASNSTEAFSKFNAKRYDILLCDIRLPGSESDGIEIVKKCSVIQPYCKFAVLSSFLYRRDYIESLHLLKNKVQILEIDKCFGVYGGDEFEEKFMQKLVDLHNLTFDSVLMKYSSGIDMDGINPFSISLEQYDNLSVEDKDKLYVFAYNVAEEQLKKAWTEGYDWVLLCGNLDLDFLGSYNEKLTDEKILEISRKRDSVPFVFYRPIDSDDVSWNECTNRNNTWYPTVTLKTNGDQAEPKILNIHFDTGTYMSLLSFEEFRPLGIVPVNSQKRHTTRRGTNEHLFFHEIDTKFHLVGQPSEQTTVVSVHALAIEDWEKTSWAKFCNAKCERQVGRNQLCPERIGLIGRELLIHNEIVITLDGKDKKTDFKIPKKKKGV